jgi:hypothetical protein
MNWKIGQKLVCIDNSTSVYGIPKPKNGEIVTYDGHGIYGGFYLLEYAEQYPNIFKGGRAEFGYDRFRPLIGESAKSELVSSFKEVTETSDCPMIPETETA